jgi:signal transduction histidine kinase
VIGIVLITTVNLALIAGLLLQRRRGRLAEAWARASDERYRSVVTDREQTNEALGQVMARHKAILRAVPDFMFVVRRDGTLVDCQARDAAIVATHPELRIGLSVRDILVPAVADTLTAAIEEACRTSDTVVVEYETGARERRWFEARLAGIDGNCVLAIVRDVTEARRAGERNLHLAGRLIASQEVERARIARDLHDDVSQEVAAVSFDLSQLLRQIDTLPPHEATKILQSVQCRTSTIAETLRVISHGLHSSVLHHLGLVAALQSHCAEVERQHDIRVEFAVQGEGEPASESVALSLFRIAQEALRNSTRHGSAQRARVSLVRTPGQLTLSITDDGSGFDPGMARQNGGLGLVSIEERARLVHGRATVHTQPGQGTTVEVAVPC